MPRERLHDRNVEASVEEQMDRGMPQIVEAKLAHERDRPKAVFVFGAEE